MKKLALVAVALCWCLHAAVAAEVPAQIVTTAVPPTLVVKQGGKSEHLGLSKLAVETRLLGPLAETRMTMTFANPHNRVLEGELYFPLPEGSTVSGYALDIKGAMIDGVVVEKHEARQVFEKIVRQGIDPGLVEWTKGSNFKTRVYPIPAKGTRTIMVRYVEELPEIGGRLRYVLPLKFKGKVPQAEIMIRAERMPGEPKFAVGGELGLAFDGRDGRYMAEAKLADAEISKDLVIEVLAKKEPMVLVEKASDGQTYFCIVDYPKAPPVEREMIAPKRVSIVWDASGSRGGADHSKEFEFIREYFAQRYMKTAKIQVDIGLLRDRWVGAGSFTVEKGDVSGIIAALKAVQYDGGTGIGSMKTPTGEVADLCLLLTDGMSTFGPEMPSPGLPMYVVSNGPGANHAFCRQVAMKTGGQYFNLDRVVPKAAAGSLGASPFSYTPTAGIAGVNPQLYPSLPVPVASRFVAVGRYTGSARPGEVKLSYGAAGVPPVTSKFDVGPAGAAEGDLLRVVWAQKKVAELSIFEKKNRDEIIRTGRKHGLVTPGTSLLVLDSLEQYVEHKIAPPKSLPQMRAKWEEIIEQRAAKQKKIEESKLKRILAMWQQRVKWWETEFKYPPDFKFKQTKAKGRNGGQGRAVGGAPVATGAPRPTTIEARPPAAPGAAEPEGAAAPHDAPAEEAEVLADAAEPDSEDAAGEATATRERSGRRRAVLRGGGSAPAKKAAGKPGASGAAIVLKAWDPKTPYLAALKAAKADERFRVYMKEKAKHGTSPAFFLDCADFFRTQKEVRLARQVLSNVAEMELGNPALLRILGHRLAQLNELDLSIQTFEEVLRLRPEEPQSFRDLALVLAERARYNATIPFPKPQHVVDRYQADYRRAVDLLYKVVMEKWDRFNEIELIALMEMNNIIGRAARAGVKADELKVDSRLVKLLDVDIRIIMTWDADLTDIDLWVTEPSGEKAYYGHRRTTIGANFSRDFTQGYGPEEYLLKKGMHGVYKVQANFYGSRQQKLQGAVTLQLEIFTDYGRPGEKRKAITLRLSKKKETIDVGSIEF